MAGDHLVHGVARINDSSDPMRICVYLCFRTIHRVDSRYGTVETSTMVTPLSVFGRVRKQRGLRVNWKV